MVSRVSGATQQWQRIAVDFEGPQLSEQSSTFSDYRLNVTFRHAETGTTLVVPGFFAADGNAANTGADTGNVWRAYFNPPMAGAWTYEASFRTGNDVAASLNSNAGAATAFDGEQGSLQVAKASTNPADSEFRTDGMIVQQPDGHYLIHKGSGDTFIKAGADSPENFLGYTDFDGTYDYTAGFLHKFAPHEQDWNPGDPSWAGGKGKGIIGAVNYLAGKGINDQYFLTMNVRGDGKDVWPWTSHEDTDRLTYDVSKLDQWEIVFEHMDSKGLMLHVVTQETENDQLLGGLTVERMVYYRELVARFGHHNGVIWNIGEENTNTAAEAKAFADYFKALDPYDHLIDIHTYGSQQDEIYGPLVGHDSLDGASLQITTGVRAEVEKWLAKSAAAGDPWVVTWDETGPAKIGVVPDNSPDAAKNHAHLRSEMWGVLTAGAGGVEWYAGLEDQTLEDFRSRDDVWTWTAAAKDFFETYLPVDKMDKADALTSGTTGNDYVIADPGEVYAIYLPSGGTATLDLGGHSGAFDVAWYNPRTGGALQAGSVDSVTAGGLVALGAAPADQGADWTILVRRAGSVTPPPPPPPGPSPSPTPSPTPYPNAITGTEGDDKLTGTSGADDLAGLGGNDLLRGEGGNDKLSGDAGKDKLVGGPGADLMLGGSGDDCYFVDNAEDQVSELADGGTEEVNSYLSFVLPDNVENLRLRSGVSVDGSGNDLGNRLWGNSGVNRLDGGAGDDILCGSGGADILIGGSGNDVFRYQALADSEGNAIDSLMDFTPGADRIDLSAIDADSTAAGKQSFSFIGGAVFTGNAGQLRFDQGEPGATAVLADVDGDAVADWAIRIEGVVNLEQVSLVL